MIRFELLEWHDRRYQHVQYVVGTREEAESTWWAPRTKPNES